jgi:hypothetical protein
MTTDMEKAWIRITYVEGAVIRRSYLKATNNRLISS